MDKRKIIKKIKEILVDELLLPYKENQIDSSKSLIKDYGIDSIQVMEMLVCLEDEFKISFEEENIEIEVLNSINSLTNFILKKIK